ncbi:MAG: hypothetical protein IJ618_10715 [Prevotella sp.]|nr:hypothetical protein [Prevotella sp.]
MKKLLFIFVISCAFSSMVKAIVVQRVTLKNGSVLNGYVQQASEGLITFHSDNAFVIIDNANVETSEQIVPVSRLDSTWIKWAEKNEAFEGVGSQRTLLLNNIVFRGNISAIDSIVPSQSSGKTVTKDFSYFLKQKRTISNVKVQEKGINVKYVEMTPNVYTISWYDVASIEIDRRPRTALSGINTTFQLRSGETYEGQKAGESLTTMNLYLPNGVVQSFNINDIVKYIYAPINPNQDIFAQSELMDIIRTSYGNELRGIILEENYSGASKAENYVLIQQESGAIQSVKLQEITSMIKEENPKYNPQFDILLNEGDVVVNRQEFNFVGVQEKDDIMTLDSLCRTNIVAKAADGRTSITVEYHDAIGGNVVPFQLVKVTKTQLKKNVYYCFSYKDLVNAVYQPQQVSTSVNQTTKVEYVVGGQGVFALYDAKKHRAIPIVVRPEK